MWILVAVVIALIVGVVIVSEIRDKLLPHPIDVIDNSGPVLPPKPTY